MLYPQGYHITWGTYGRRLPGTDRPHVDKKHNEYGTPLPPPNPDREEAARESMSDDPVSLSFEQRKIVEDAIESVARRYGWKIHAIAAQSDHVHVVITAMREGPELREALKACASRELNERFGKRKWWAEGGSAKYLWEGAYFKNAVKYVRDQRDF